MKYRSRTEIVTNILCAAVGGSIKSKIMYKSFLSHDQLKVYLALLVENGLLDYDMRTLEYKTTEKETRFLNIHDKLFEMWQSGSQE